MIIMNRESTLIAHTTGIGYSSGMQKKHFFSWVIVSTLLFAASANAQPVISDVQVKTWSDGREVITLQATEPLSVVKQFALSNPDRVVIDMRSATGKTVALPADYDGELMTSLRFGQFNPTTSRLVIETKTPVTLLASKRLTKGLSLTLDRADSERATMQSSEKNLSIAVPSTPTSPKTTKPSVVKSPAVASVAAPTSVANVKPLIVLDAGHGGQDPGASGVHDVHEKHITLAMVKAIRDALQATGRYRVALTRDDDRYILLPERVNIARKQKAAIFISIHADSNPVPEARGLSIYTVSETASDKESQALAERENKSDIIGGLDLNTADKDVANILIDLTQHETATKSLELADALVASMHPKITKLEHTHRFAGFRVLKAPDVPSVLIELGFLSNATDERLLQSDSYRQLVAASVVKGIDRYRAAQKKQ
ncbi:MAG: hypothetical protein B7X02_01075 [Rhodospirillales bacterium 12-54-5]|nr:MAG: hypothetical protein B7X02_01075 [Rhodospirillales bacterium 12-54-5]